MKLLYYIIIIGCIYACKPDKDQYLYKDYLYQTALETLQSSWILENTPIKNYKLLAINNQVCQLYDTIPDSSIILYLNYTMCHPCIIDNIKKLDTLKQTSNRDIYIILTYPESLSNCNLYTVINDLKYPFFQLKQELIQKVEIQTPLFFIYENKKITKPYLSVKGIDDFFITYLNILNK